MFLLKDEEFGKDRYNPRRLVKEYNWEVPFLDYLDSAFIYRLRSLPTKGILVISNQEYRPDLVSYDIYGTTDLWWVILVYNSLSLFSLTQGRKVSYPSISDIEELLHSIVIEAQKEKQPV